MILVYNAAQKFFALGLALFKALFKALWRGVIDNN
jgi:hypothetical protein